MLQKEKQEKEELEEMKITSHVNERSIKILKKLREIQNQSNGCFLKQSGIGNKNKSLSPVQSSFRPALSEKTKILTLNRTASVFDRLYQPKTLKKDQNSQPILRNKKGLKLNSCNVSQNYSINSSRGIITDNSIVAEEVKYERNMKFLLQDLC